jgi:hypothetical protein
MKILARASLSFRAEPRPIVSLIFEPRDLWIGCFWDHVFVRDAKCAVVLHPYLVVYLVAVPTLVVRLHIPLKVRSIPLGLPGEKP